MDSPLHVLSDLSERLDYNVTDFPIYVKKDELSRYGYEALCHWHPDLEFIYIVSGAMDYFINGKKVRIQQGQGIFVNSRRLHYGFSAQKEDCTFIALVIHPSLFIHSCDRAKVFAEQKFGFANVDYMLLYPHVLWHKTILHSIERLYQEMNTVPFNPLRLLAKAIFICADMGEHMETAENDPKNNGMQMAFLNMTEYIHNNYKEKLTIDKIANAGAVCRSKGCQLFQQYARMTPTAYVTKYRLSKSAELLRDTELSITEIASICGFQSSSYYISLFKRKMGQTPRRYRDISRRKTRV